jgi:polar amino acid transport system substrate-binding protein
MTKDIVPPLAPTPELIKELAPTGTLRVAINFGNTVLAQREAESGEARGISVDLTYALGQVLQIPVELVGFDAAGKVVDALTADRWDLAFLAIDPRREEDMAFSLPYLTIEGTYLVKAASRFQETDDLDADGVRIAVGTGAAYELYLSRNLKLAQIIRQPTAAEAFQTFLDQDLDAVAGVRQVVDGFAQRQHGLRVLPGRFMSIGQALAVPKGRIASANFLNKFIEAKIADGSVAESSKRNNKGG